MPQRSGAKVSQQLEEEVRTAPPDCSELPTYHEACLCSIQACWIKLSGKVRKTPKNDRISWGEAIAQESLQSHSVGPFPSPSCLSPFCLLSCVDNPFQPSPTHEYSYYISFHWSILFLCSLYKCFSHHLELFMATVTSETLNQIGLLFCKSNDLCDALLSLSWTSLRGSNSNHQVAQMGKPNLYC